MYGFSRRVLALSAFLLIATALSPLFVHSQSPTSATLQIRVDDLQSRLNRLDTMPQEITEIQTKLQGIEDWQKQTSNTITYITVAIFGAIGLKLLEVFGVRIKRKEDD